MMASLSQSGDLGRKETPPRRRHQRATAADELREALGALGIAQYRAARLFGIKPRSLRRWRSGDRHTPRAVNLMLRLLAMGVITVDQIELAAAAIPARANDRTNPEPPALPVAAAPEQPVTADTEAAALTGTVAAVCGLAADACRWPFGNPGHADFRFCGAPTVKQPYCEAHRGRAYWTLPTWRRAGRPAPRPPF